MKKKIVYATAMDWKFILAGVYNKSTLAGIKKVIKENLDPYYTTHPHKVFKVIIEEVPE